MGVRIFLFDPVTYNRITMKNVLEKNGYEVTGSAGAPEQFIGLLKRQPVDLIIGDFTAPHLKGSEFVKSFFEIRKEIRVLLCAISEKIKRKQLEGMGIIGFIPKPVDAKVLVQEVQKALSKSPKTPSDDLSKVSLSSSSLMQKASTVPSPTPAHFETPIKPGSTSVPAGITNEMNICFVTPVMEAIWEILVEMVDPHPDRGTTFYMELSITTMGIASIIDIVGDYKGKIVLDMKRETAIQITKDLTKDDISPDDEMVYGVIGEVVNTIAGKAVSKLSPYGHFDISPPSFLRENIIKASSNKTKIMIVPIGLRQGLINVNFFIA